MAIIVSDNFNRANSSTTLGTTPVGGKVWQKYGTQQWGIQNNMAYPVTILYDKPTYVDIGVADQIAISVKLGVYQSTGQFHYRNVSDGNGYFFESPGLYKLTAGNFTEMGRFTMATGDVIKVELRGNQHTIFVNGVQRLQFTDAAHNTGTRAGFAGNSTTVRYDDFLVETFFTAPTPVKIGELRFKHPSRVIAIPIYSTTDFPTESYRIQTPKGTGYIPLVLTTDATASAIRVQTSKGLRALKL